MNTAAVQTAKSRLPPPLPNLAGVLLGVALGWLHALPIGSHEVALCIGLGLIAAAVWLGAVINRAFRLHGTPADPAEETTAIVDTGPFRFSRNPVYLVFALLQVGFGLMLNNLWIVLLTPPASLVVHYVVVLREEAYLEEKFGRAYLVYKARVRRWL
jgi:protein-S-isoprenylcysteine O-methyltransferase Ste14